MNINLSPEANELLSKYRSEYKERGIKTKNWNAILSNIILSCSDSQWVEMIEEQTPIDYHINQAMGDENLKVKILQAILKENKSKVKKQSEVENLNTL